MDTEGKQGGRGVREDKKEERGEEREGERGEKGEEWFYNRSQFILQLQLLQVNRNFMLVVN